ncbi:MAG: ParB/RepB/Spo0J family partition protein [Calditrichaeota bacterium]|nr:ParB/RepB/Spo0J family partition protein [Candidatus Cloacimonadota bacterium]MCA9787925.1 ParB/RepB/Spo0J family partition protein [Candidatus Cloacimonadota bacterium]MCB1046669.1 ParB/RepB/Spo0J family partition protein [Calditrichota bacterium]MCB9473068.1 ParB/RepB/Spo0J family partition protein [Candidatus Delongbacteria bacterium]
MNHSKPLGKGLAALIPDNRTPRSEHAGDESVRELPLSEIRPNAAQPRREMNSEALTELAASIKVHGVLQPILVFEEHGAYTIIAGERRYRASIQSGRTRIPAIVRPRPEPRELLKLALIENIQREDLGPLDLAASYRQLLDEHGMTQEELADTLAVSRSMITNTMRLLKLPAVIKLSIKNGEFSVGHAKVLLGVASDDDRVALWHRCIKKQLSVRQLEELVTANRDGARKGKTATRVEKPFDLLEAEDRMRSSLGTQVQISPRRKGGLITIEYYSGEELDRLLDMLTNDRDSDL